DLLRHRHLEGEALARRLRRERREGLGKGEDAVGEGEAAAPGDEVAWPGTGRARMRVAVPVARPRAGDEIDEGHEAARLMRHQDDGARRQRLYVMRAARADKAQLRLGIRADHRRIEVAEAVD